MRVIHDEYRDVIDRKSCGTCAKRELVERISGSSEISGIRLQDRRAGINSSYPSKSWFSFDSSLSLSLSLSLVLLFFVLALYLFSTERFCSFFDGPAPILTIDVFLVCADALQALPPFRLLLFFVSVSVSGEDVSAASFRSQKQPDHHPRDHSLHLWNDRNGVARYLHKWPRKGIRERQLLGGRGALGW